MHYMELVPRQATNQCVYSTKNMPDIDWEDDQPCYTGDTVHLKTFTISRY